MGQFFLSKSLKELHLINDQIENMSSEKKTIKEYKIKKHFKIKTRNFIAIIIITGVLTIVIYPSLLKAVPSLSKEDVQNIVSLTNMIITLGAFIIAYQKWSESTFREPIDNFYERLSLTNRKFDEWPQAREMFPEFWKIDDGQASNNSEQSLNNSEQSLNNSEQSFRRIMYVYLELDNLEYIIMGYQRGYVDDNLALRGIQTFESRCIASPQFVRIADYIRKNSKSYNEETMKVVETIIKKLQNKRRATVQ